MPGGVVSKDAHQTFYAKHQGASGGRRPEGRIVGPVEGVKAFRSRTPEERQLVRGINDWERGTGMKYHREYISRPDQLKVRARPVKMKQHEAFHRAVVNAPTADRPLYRGIMLHPDEVEAIQVGQRIDRGKESWTDRQDKAEKFAIEQRRRHPSMYKKTAHTVIEMPAGSKALNIQGVARYDMGEFVAAHPYRVTGKTVENGTHRVTVAQGRKFYGNQYVKVSKADDVDFLDMPGMMAKPDTRTEELTAVRTRDLKTGRFVGAPTLVSKGVADAALSTAAWGIPVGWLGVDRTKNRKKRKLAQMDSSTTVSLERKVRP